MDRTDFLFARPSFIEGMARVLDLGNTLNMYNYSSSAVEADNRALNCDFLVTLKDIKNSMNQYEQKAKMEGIS